MVEFICTQVSLFEPYIENCLNLDWRGGMRQKAFEAVFFERDRDFLCLVFDSSLKAFNFSL